MRTHHKHGTFRIFLTYIFSRSIQFYNLLQSPLVNHPLQHLLPLPLSKYVKSPLRHLQMHLLPHLYKSVKTLLIVKAPHSNNPLGRAIRIFIGNEICRIRYHSDSWHISPHLLILLGQDNKTVKSPDQSFIHKSTDLIRQSHKTGPVVLMMKKLALMKFHHFLATVLERRDKRTFTRIETVYNIWTLFLQQRFQTLLMHLTASEIAQQFLHERSAVVIRIIDPKINHPDSFRKRIERRSAMLVRRHDSHIPPLLINKVTYLIEKHALHSAGVICRVDT